MAGDWIKMRGNLWDDPRVGALVDATDSSEAAVVGGLYWLWATADQHSEDGAMPGLTLRQIDRKTGIPGFAAALVAIGWITDHVEGVCISKFEEHNGASAKKRCQTAKRVANHTAKNADVTPSEEETNAQSVSGALAREEKRREDYSVPNGTDAAAASTPELTKAELWKAGKSLLAEQGMAKDQCGSFVGKLVKDYGDAVVVAAVRTACVTRPADAAEYLKATCMHAAGQRKQAEPEWRTEQRERTQQAAPGVAVFAQPAQEFFIEVEARRVLASALG